MHTQTWVTGVLVPYHGFSTEADQWFLSANTRPLTTAQRMGNCVCMCVCACAQGQHARVYLSLLPALYHPLTFRSHDLPFHSQKGLCPYLLPPSLFIQRFSLSLRFQKARQHHWEWSLLGEDQSMLKTQKLSVIRAEWRSVLTRAQLFFPLKVKGHLLNIPANIFRRCQMSHSCARCIRLFWDGGRWFPPPPSNIQKRALSTTYRILHKENTHSQTHARIIPPYTPPCVARLCFCLCKITVVQVSSRQSDADRQARKEDSQALVFATKIFLVLQLAVLPSMWLWLQNPSSSSGSRLHLPEEHRGRWKVLSKTSGKVASSFKGPRMYTAHGFLC